MGIEWARISLLYSTLQLLVAEILIQDTYESFFWHRQYPKYQRVNYFT
jgi:hypothetical protein